MIRYNVCRLKAPKTMPPIEDIDRLVRFEYFWGILNHKHFQSTYGWKKHQAISMWYVHSGGSEIETRDGKRYIIRPGEIKLIPSGVAFRESITDHPCACSSGALFRFRLFDSITFSERLRLPMHVKGDDARRLKPLLVDLIKDMPTAQTLDLSAMARVKQHAMQILSILIELSPDDPSILMRSSGYSTLAPAIDYMHTHLSEKMTRAQLAHATHLSESALYKKFRDHLDCSPMEYLTRLRVEKARQLLLQTTMTLAEIAVHTGFSSPYHLSSIFKKTTGQSPSSYRNAKR